MSSGFTESMLSNSLLSGISSPRERKSCHDIRRGCEGSSSDGNITTCCKKESCSITGAIFSHWCRPEIKRYRHCACLRTTSTSEETLVEYTPKGKTLAVMPAKHTCVHSGRLSPRIPIVTGVPSSLLVPSANMARAICLILAICSHHSVGCHPASVLL